MLSKLQVVIPKDGKLQVWFPVDYTEVVPWTPLPISRQKHEFELHKTLYHTYYIGKITLDGSKGKMISTI